MGCCSNNIDGVSNVHGRYKRVICLFGEGNIASYSGPVL